MSCDRGHRVGNGSEQEPQLRWSGAGVSRRSHAHQKMNTSTPLRKTHDVHPGAAGPGAGTSGRGGSGPSVTLWRRPSAVPGGASPASVRPRPGAAHRGLSGPTGHVSVSRCRPRRCRHRADPSGTRWRPRGGKAPRAPPAGTLLGLHPRGGWGWGGLPPAATRGPLPTLPVPGPAEGPGFRVCPRGRLCPCRSGWPLAGSLCHCAEGTDHLATSSVSDFV